MTDYTVKPGDRIITTGPVALAVGALPPPPIAYTFLEEFSGDLSKWRHDFRHLIGSTAAWDPANSRIANGNLEVDVVRRADGTWSGDQLNTAFRQLYGRFGCRAKAGKGKGVFGAPLWMYAAAAATATTSAYENEIDIVEIAGNPNVVHTTIHFPPNAKYPAGSLGHAYDAGVDLSLAFHDYECVWSPPDATRLPSLVFYFDGKEIWRVPDADRALIPTHPLPLITDNAVGGGWAGNPDATTPSPCRMLVDRVWATA